MAESTATVVIRRRFRWWLAGVVLLATVFASVVLPRLRIETDILALLPNGGDSATASIASEKFSRVLADKLVILVGADELQDARLAAQAYAASLSASRAFADVQLEVGAVGSAWAELYPSHRGWLLSKSDVALLQAGKQQQLHDAALRAAFTPSSLMRAVSFADDPLGLQDRFLASRLVSSGAAQLDGDMLVVNAESRYFVLLTAAVDGSAFATDVQDAAGAQLEIAARSARIAIASRSLEILVSGTMPHAAAARARATAEISTFGSIETILVVVLLVAVFSALRPLALGPLSTAVAFLAGISATHAAFGNVHLLALVFGSSLIGGVIDYSIHFFADRFRTEQHWTPATAVAHVGGAIAMGCVATLIGYLVLLAVPLPGLRQIAMFCMSGLAAGCLTVLCAYPALYRAPNRLWNWGPRVGAWLVHRMSNAGSRRVLIVAGVALIAMASAGLIQIRLQDDVRALQSSPPALLATEARVAALLQTGIESRYFIVLASTPQSLLERETQLTTALTQLERAGALRGHVAISDALPPLSQQQAAHSLLATHVLGESGIMQPLLRELGYSAIDAAQRTRNYAANTTPLDVPEWLASQASRPWRDLWVGAIGEDGAAPYASVVSLAGVSDVKALRALAQPESGAGSIHFVDRVQSISDVLGRYRVAVSWLLSVVYLAALLLLGVRFGWRIAPLLVFPSALASVVTLGIFGLTGVPVNLFTMLALWLVLGLGIDYGIFLRHGKDEPAIAVLSVTLSAITTLLAFGMLAFSATPFIRSIGLTLLCAITFSWFFALTLSMRKQPMPAETAT